MASSSKPDSSNAVRTEAETSEPAISIYGTPSHNFCGPSYEDGDWTGDLLDGLYYLRLEPQVVTSVVDLDEGVNLWHRRLGHPYEKDYPSGQKGWYLYDLERGDYFVSRDVVFYETHFPYLEAATQRPVHPAKNSTHDVSPATESPPSSEVPVTGHSTNVEQQNSMEQAADQANPQMGRGYRPKYLNSTLRDYVLEKTVKGSSPSNASFIVVRSSSSGTLYPLINYVSSDKFTVEHRNFLAAIMTHKEPSSFKEAVKDEGWRKGMGAEMKALHDNGTWNLVPLPDGKRPLGSKWLYKIKYKSDGFIERLKARLVIFGNHQTHGIDYEETFAPIAKMTTVQTFLAVAATKK
ncbi:uncharacterized protein LOC141651795 [Silene latifolia]|uniref:uncharacterized protein LOC141651795 n=1 Tax=Silene latifolia TaxID=37657 RepID=UPI003D779DCB